MFAGALFFEFACNQTPDRPQSAGNNGKGNTMPPNKSKFTKLWESGTRTQTIADMLGMTQSGVSYWARKFDLEPRRRREPLWTKSEIKTLRKLRRECKTGEDIAKQLGRSPNSVYSAIYRYGAPFGVPKPRAKIHAIDFKMRKITFFPPPWNSDLDHRLFEKCRNSHCQTGRVYDAICRFADRHSLTIDAVQLRWHRIAAMV